ncbi:MAG: hypothetical protein JSW39_04710 [Desulfobacterales bacterium]|nr:MAG: hypothetical protein JSW39_04710 [Desulfobacterales bacterium]
MEKNSALDAGPESSAVETQTGRPFPTAILILIIGLILAAALIINASRANSKKYYIRSNEGVIEIWQGTYSPLGEKRLARIPSAEPPATIKPTYSRAEVAPLIFKHYVDQADALAEVPGTPDFAVIKSSLNQALAFATTDELRNTVFEQLNSIDLMTLLYKADAAARKKTAAGLKAAQIYLKQAAELKPGVSETQLIEQKLESIQKSIEELSNPKLESSTTPAPPPQAPEEAEKEENRPGSQTRL